MRQGQLEKEDTMIIKWAQEDVETLYNLLSSNNNLNMMLSYKQDT
jgi:hypothetical protein